MSVSATVEYNLATKNLDNSLAVVAKTPEVARETEYYLAHIGNVKSIDDFMNDKRLVNYAMTAYGLGDLSYATAFIRKLLKGGIDDSNALANKLTDPKYAAFVSTFNFVRYGSATTAFSSTQQGTVDLYNRQALEQSVGDQNDGARLALYFQRKAPTIKSSLYILADAALLKVAQTALGLSPYMSNLSIEAQQAMIDKKLNVADLQDPTKLAKFLTRFTALYDVQNPDTSAPDSTAALLQPIDFSTPMFSTDTLMSLQKLKTGF
jgi:hypothetical protein